MKKSAKLLPRIKTNLQSITDEILPKAERLTIRCPFFEFDGTPEEFKAQKPMFRAALVQYLQQQGKNAK